MKFFAVTSAFVACASTALAAPTEGCITLKAAKQLVNRFIGVQQQTGSDLGDYTATADVIIANDFTEYSDSITMLMGKELTGAPVFSSKAEYLATISNSPPQTGIETRSVRVAGCKKVLWEWNRPNVGSGQYAVHGYSLFTVNRNNQLKKANIEFNSLAWSLDTATTTTTTDETTETTDAT